MNRKKRRTVERQKTSNKNQKSQKKTKLNTPAIFLIIILIIFTVGYLFLKPTSNKKRNYNKVERNIIREPKFMKEGELTIFEKNTKKLLVKIDIEIANNEPERIQGLMYRKSMDELAGMFFIFDSEEPRSFWMRNTYISLDIIYINSKNQVVSIQKNTKPLSPKSLPSEAPAIFVLEVNAGFCDKYSIEKGCFIEFKN